MLSAPHSTLVKRPWRDLTDGAVALLYYDLGEYAPGFFREVRNQKVPREVKAVVRAAISRAMKRLASRGLIKRFGQNRDERTFYASCDLTAEGFFAAERLANTLTVICLPDTHPT